ncbi:MAG: hypothetical protein LBG83_07210 [Oscillospiraceae bacterium]|jgi:hypothetical protein|nr:hypothetical protein [Oscillospiraceae bacterium]
MNYASFMSGLTNFFDWIQNNVINGFVANMFEGIKNFFLLFIQFRG